MNAQRLEKLKEWETQKPDDAFLKFAIATEYVSGDDDKTAKKYFELLLEKYSDYLPTYYHLGKLYERLDDSENASRTYLKGIEIAKAQNDSKTIRELNEALMILKDE